MTCERVSVSESVLVRQIKRRRGEGKVQNGLERREQWQMKYQS